MNDADIIAAARAGFLDEAADMLQQFEQALLVMETAPDDSENLNAAFRAAHTIKGTAGLFGCEAVVAFTHEVETLMEALRSGALAVSEDITAALLQGRDQIGVLLAEVRDGTQDPAVQARSAALGERLRQLHGAIADESPAPTATAGATPAAAGTWHLSLRFGADALRNGLDPLAFLRYLGTVGSVTACRTLHEAVPALESLDAEACHLGFEMRLQSSAARTEIEQVFEFALEDCALGLLGPQATADEYRALLEDRSAGDAEARSALLDVWQALGVPPALWQAPPAAATPPPRPWWSAAARRATAATTKPAT